MTSDLMDPAASEVDEQFGRIRLYGDNITVSEDVEIRSGKLFLYANDTVRIKQGSKLLSLVKNDCTTDNTGNRDLF